MKDYLQQFIKKHPNHYVKMLKCDQDIYDQIMKIPNGRNFKEKIYFFIHVYDNQDLCRHCGSITPFQGYFVGFRNYCSNACFNRSEEFHRKRVATFRKKYGVDNPAQAASVKEKMAQTNLNRYGHCNAMHNKDIAKKHQETMNQIYLERGDAILQKHRDTLMERYGVDNASKIPEVKEKLSKEVTRIWAERTAKDIQFMQKNKRNTCLEIYGVTHPMKHPNIAAKTQASNVQTWFERHDELIKKREKTSLGRFGVTHHLKNAEMYEKHKMASKRRLKEFITPTGDVWHVQGNEPIVLSELFEQGYAEKELIINAKHMPKFEYINTDGKTHRYYPDIYIPNENLIIEVKSKWTYENDYKRNQLKKKSVIDAGYEFKFMIRN